MKHNQSKPSLPVNQELLNRPLVHYSVDWSKVRTLVDMIDVFRALDIHFHYPQGMDPPPYLKAFLIREGMDPAPNPLDVRRITDERKRQMD